MTSFGPSRSLRFGLSGSVRSLAAVFALALGATLATPTVGLAQEHAPAPAAENVDIITPHITDSYHLEIPWFNSHFAKEVCIGRHLANGECGPLWDPVHIGGLEVNLSPTKHAGPIHTTAVTTVAIAGNSKMP